MELPRWQKLMSDFGLSHNVDTFQALTKAYSEPHRRYHTHEHISATLRHLDSVPDLADNIQEIEIALWFHDAIYKPFSAKNELESAVWASTFLSDNGVSQDRIDRVYKLVMATAHTANPDVSDQSLIVDIDLSILGASTATYEQFENDVRYEYKLVPYFFYRKKRKEILANFLERDRIYKNDFFHSRLEDKARSNLTNAVRLL